MTSVLDRSVIAAGKVFIRAGEEHSRAYLVQSGTVQSFVEENGRKIVVGEYDSGRIIAETCLMVDEPMSMSYEAVTHVEVITMTRQNFQDKLRMIDKDLQKVIQYTMDKLNYQDISAIDKAKKRNEIEPAAQELVDSMVAQMSDERKFQYEQAMLPHLNSMIKAVKALQSG